ncbi:hypothetical protein ELI03_23160 [Rhizobium leguminosarum]|uniref:Uncharacterized protein n=1 Tax=Rhizobium leguminosarum TaxID=384 RepID=A0A4Q8Y4Q9_RHILE|nr:hypothetical protein ELI03_23160 [Rhizobium leguminosarum]
MADHGKRPWRRAARKTPEQLEHDVARKPLTLFGIMLSRGRLRARATGLKSQQSKGHRHDRKSPRHDPLLHPVQLAAARQLDGAGVAAYLFRQPR